MTLPQLVDVADRKTAATTKLKAKFEKVVNEFDTPRTCVGKISEHNVNGCPEMPIWKQKRKMKRLTKAPQPPISFHSSM